MLRRVAACLIAILSVALPPNTAADTDSETASLERWIGDTAATNRYRLDFDGADFSGPGWQRLLSEGRKSQFFLLGEEHGIAENAKLAARLFEALTDSGYSRFLIEISPPMANIVDEALFNGGLDGLRRLYAEPGGEPAFFGMAEEAEMLAAVRSALPGKAPVLWGADYEVASDRALLRTLSSRSKPPAAQEALATLAEASTTGWNRHAETGQPEFIFTFSGDPELVRNVESAWPLRDADSAWILDTLEATLEINQYWAAGEGYQSNARRAALLRQNFIRHWREAKIAGHAPRVIAKFGANHLVRGQNMTQTFDLGSLLPELAALVGRRSFSVMVIPGKGSSTAVLNASSWRYEPSPPKNSYARGLEPLMVALLSDAFTLIDLAPIRAVLSSNPGLADDRLQRVVFGYDMLLVMSGSTAATEFEHD